MGESYAPQHHSRSAIRPSGAVFHAASIESLALRPARRQPNAIHRSGKTATVHIRRSFHIPYIFSWRPLSFSLSRSPTLKPTLYAKKEPPMGHFNRATRVISVPASAFDTGQFCFAPCAYSWNFASSIPGISASVSRAMPVIANASPTFSSLTVALV